MVRNFSIHANVMDYTQSTYQERAFTAAMDVACINVIQHPGALSKIPVAITLHVNPTKPCQNTWHFRTLDDQPLDGGHASCWEKLWWSR